MSGRRFETWAIVLGVLALTVLPVAVEGRSLSAGAWAQLAVVVGAGLLLVVWRQHPVVTTVGGGRSSCSP